MSLVYLIIFLLAFGVSYLFTPLVRWLCLKMHWLDKPDPRKINKTPIPRAGGIAIFLGFLVSMLFVALKTDLLTDLHRLFSLLSCCFVMALIGLEDDIHGLSARRKLFYQLVISAIIFLYGFGIGKVSHPWQGEINLPFLISMAITVFWITGFTNAINLIDGLDGLAGGIVVIIAVSLFFASVRGGVATFVPVVSLGLAGSALGFLRFNFYPAKIFMGDTGSMLMGFLIAIISLEGAFKGATFVTLFVPIIAMGVPVLDTGLAILRRLIKGNGVFKPDKEHIHHKLLLQEGSQRQAVLKLYFITLCFGLIAMGLNGMKGIWLFAGIIVTALITLRLAVRFNFLDFLKQENSENLD